MLNYEHLSYQERVAIRSHLTKGSSIRRIGEGIGRAPSTISREYKRNGFEDGYYSPTYAEQTKDIRRQKCRRSKIEKNIKQKAFIIDKLKEGWSPESIAGRWNLTNENNKICKETIYRWIYDPTNMHLKLFELLPRAKKKRGLKYPKRFRRESKVSIHNRPEIINKRERVGDIEADLIFGCNSRSVNVLVIVDRKTRYVSLFKNNTKRSEEVLSHIKPVLEEYYPKSVKSITFDNGREFNQYKSLEVPVYFCDPGCPWQKGSVEQCNGLLRRYLPYNKAFGAITQEELDIIAFKKNHIPRKSLNFLTPCEALWGPFCRCKRTLKELEKNSQCLFCFKTKFESNL